jgi:hypothetical protein
MKVMDEVSNSVGANATNNNVLSSRRFERAPFTGLMTVYSTGSAAGLEEEINVGGVSVTPRAVVNAQNRSPVAPDDLRIADVPVFQGQLIQITVANTTAGALTHRLRIEIEQAA